MRTRLLNKKTEYYEYMDEPTEYDEYEYLCPCGKGKIVETHDETPWNREHMVWLLCDECKEKYKFDTSKGVRNWELEMNKWDLFLDSLESDNDFDKDLKEYLNAIKYISEIQANKIDSPDIGQEINEQLDIIVNFINKYSENNYEIGLIKGFKTNTNEKIKGRDYYYYIADQKMKASVYYVRYLNFINQHLGMNECAEMGLSGRINELREQFKDIDISKDNVISIIDDKLEQTEENQKLRQECIEYIQRIRTNDITYMKYMMFNNMMREIRFIGAAYQYLWHWETKTKNLFRYVSYDGGEINLQENCTKKDFLQKMFSDVISHMNNSSKELCSYSEDPYIDIFKYLKMQKSDCAGFVDIYSDDVKKISIRNLENDKKARFDVVKGVSINSIYRDHNAKSFYDFVQDGKKLNDSESLAYAIELYPDLPEREKNSKNTSKNIKELLLEYLSTWSDGEDRNKLMSYVADDKEVVTYGKIEIKEIDIKETVPEDFCNRCRYTMEFDKNELIYLLLKLNKTDVNKIVEHYKISLNWDSTVNNWIGAVIVGEEKQEHKINGQIPMQLTDKKQVAIDICISLSPSIIRSEKQDTNADYKKRITEEIEKEIQGYFKKRYKRILNENHMIGEFVLNFIKKEGYSCPSYISEYNEYEPEKGDQEISILKYLIFKGDK